MSTVEKQTSAERDDAGSSAVDPDGDLMKMNVEKEAEPETSDAGRPISLLSLRGTRSGGGFEGRVRVSLGRSGFQHARGIERRQAKRLSVRPCWYI